MSQHDETYLDHMDADQLWEESRRLYRYAKQDALIACRHIVNGHYDAAVIDAHKAIDQETRSLTIGRRALGDIRS